MTQFKRSLAVIAGLTVLAISAQAQTISNLTATYGSATQTSSSSFTFTDPSQGGVVTTAGAVANGSFTLTGPASYVTVDPGAFTVVDGTLSLELYTTDSSHPFYSIFTSTDPGATTISTGSLFTGPAVTVHYEEVLFLAPGGALYASPETSASFSATPEPASYAVMGLGLVGLMIRRKKGSR
jgi:hypothetical protein